MTTGFYSIVVPVGDRRNLATNPSLETGTAGWGTLQGGTVGTISSVQAFGAWAGSIAPSSNGTAGALGPTFTAGNGIAYSYSVYGSLPVGSVYRFGIGDSNGASIVGTFLGTGGGTWHRYIGSFTEASGAARRLAVRKNSNAATDAFYLDGLQYEAGSVTTYIDGDQAGMAWDGQPHLSTSLRPAALRTGGTVYSLNSLGMRVLEHGGIGMPDVTNVMQDYGLIDGAYYQRTRANVRAFLLTGFFSGTTYQGLHAIRQQIIDVIRPDLTPTPQPFRLFYTGAGGSVQIDCLYDSGLQYGERSGFAETAAIRFIAPDPYWQTILERGTSLGAFNALGSTNNLAYRSPIGLWGTLGINGTTTATNGDQSRVRALAVNVGGTLAVGGVFGSVGGTTLGAGNGFGFYANGTFGTIPNSQFTSGCFAVAFDMNGTIWAAEPQANYSGSGAVVVATVGGASWGTPTGGTLRGGGLSVESIISFNGSMVVATQSAAGTAGGTVTQGVVYHGPSAWGTLVGGTFNGAGRVTAIGRRLVASTNNSGGTSTSNSGLGWYEDGRFGTIPSEYTLTTVLAIAALPNGNVAVGGGFTAGVTTNVVQTNFAGVTTMGLGLGTTAAQRTWDVKVSPSGVLWAGGRWSSTGSAVAFPSSLARWTGASWVTADIDLPTPGTVYAIAFAPDGGMYAGGSFIGTARAATVTTLVSQAGAQTTPRLFLRGPSSGTARVYQFANNTTGDSVFFDLAVQANETIKLDLTPASVALTSVQRGNLLGAILPGSNLAQWRLQRGTNFVSFFADNASLRADIVYRPRFWSADTAED